MVEPISSTPSTPINSTSGDPYPLPPKQTPEEPTQIFSLEQYFSGLPSPLPPQNTPAGPLMYLTSANSVVTIYIPSDDNPNIILYADPYVLINHSPSGTYLLPSFITYAVFYPSNLSPIPPSK